MLIFDIFPIENIAFHDIYAEFELCLEQYSLKRGDALIALPRTLAKEFSDFNLLIFNRNMNIDKRMQVFQVLAKSYNHHEFTIATIDGSGEPKVNHYNVSKDDVLTKLLRLPQLTCLNIIEILAQQKFNSFSTLLTLFPEAVNNIKDQLNSIITLVERVFVESSILTRLELEKSSYGDCHRLCSMEYIEKSLGLLNGSKKLVNRPLQEVFIGHFANSFKYILTFRHDQENCPDESRSLANAYFALAVFSSNLSILYLNRLTSSTAFILAMRTLDFYLISVLISSGDIFPSPIGSNATALYMDNKIISGIGPLWYKVEKIFSFDNNQKDLIRTYLKVRNSNVLAHGLNMSGHEYASITHKKIIEIILTIEKQIPKSKTRWNTMHESYAEFLEAPLDQHLRDNLFNLIDVEVIKK